MRVGVAFPTTEIGNDPGTIRAFAQMAEALGYDHLTCIDHVLGERTAQEGWKAYYTRDNPFHEPFVLFGFLAACTTRLGFATAIVILPQRPAALVAKQAAEIDVLSGGRLRLGVGIGWNAVEFEALGLDFRTRARRMEEQIVLMRRLWTEELVTFSGAFHTVSDAGINPLPVQRPIPLWIGAFEDAAIRRAGRVADGWFANPRVPAGDENRRQVDVLREAARAAGRDPMAIGIDATIHIGGGKTPDQVAEEAAFWRELGATHLTLRTMYAGLQSPGHHIAALERFRPALG